MMNMMSEQTSNQYAALTSKRNVEKDNGISGLGIAVSHLLSWPEVR